MWLTRFVTTRHPQGVCGILEEGGSIRLLKGGLLDPLETTGEVIPEGDIVRYLSPVDPPNLLAIGLNYVDHAAESNDPVPEAPLLFIKSTTCVAAHGDTIVLPRVAPHQVDYEAELGAVIGKRARDVSVEEAPRYILGYTCGHDVSARDCQSSDKQWARGKSFDTFGPLGPCVVTDIDPGDLPIRFRLNGNLMQDSTTANMVFSPAKLVSYLSHCMTLLPGTVIMTGTPPGVGFARTPPVFLQPGDVCEVDIQGIGVLRNIVAAG